MDTNYIKIFDTTLRDGEQSPGATLTSNEKLEIARMLARMGVDVIEAGFPAASPDDLEGVRGWESTGWRRRIFSQSAGDLQSGTGDQDGHRSGLGGDPKSCQAAYPHFFGYLTYSHPIQAANGT